MVDRQRVSHLSFGNVGLRTCHPRGLSEASRTASPLLSIQRKVPSCSARAAHSRNEVSIPFDGRELVFDTFSIRVMYTFKPFFQFVPISPS